MQEEKMQASKAEIAARKRACKTKCEKMTLTNHGTAFNALRDLGEEHVAKLKAMGYNTNLIILHDFGWSCSFDPNNGAFGALFMVQLQTKAVCEVLGASCLFTPANLWRSGFQMISKASSCSNIATSCQNNSNP